MSRKSEAMILLAAALDSDKDGKSFTFERAADALRSVIKESSEGASKKAKGYIRCHAAALFAVHMQDERAAAEKRGARKGYVLLLEHLEKTATVAVYKYDPEGSWLTKSFPDAAARLMTPTAVYAAQAEVEISEAPERERKEKEKAEEKVEKKIEKKTAAATA